MAEANSQSQLSEANRGKNEFFFTWVIENFSCLTLKYGEQVESPSFFIYVPEETEWKCSFYPSGQIDAKHASLFLLQIGNGNINSMSFGFCLQMLNQEGLPEISETFPQKTFHQKIGFGSKKFISKNDLCVVKRKQLLHNDCLILRARIWTPEGCGDLAETSHCLARTRIAKEAISFLSIVEQFGSITSGTNKTVVAPTASEIFRNIAVDLSLQGGPCCSENLKIEVSMEDLEDFKIAFASVTLLENENVDKKNKALPDTTDRMETRELPCFYPTELLSKKGYLKNDTLHLYFKFVVSRGVAYEAIESVVSGQGAFMDESRFVRQMLRGDDFDDSEKSEVLNDLSRDLQSMHLDGLMTDVTLQVGPRTFPAHRNILSARSPVFRAMFAADMREGAEGTVQVEDVDGETLQRLLDFLYTDSAGDLKVDTATKLYFAADKYQVLRLRRACADFLLKNMCVDNVCDLLLVADACGDDRFKSSVVSFVVEHCEEVIESDPWMSLMKSHGTLAAEIMHRKLSKG